MGAVFLYYLKRKGHCKIFNCYILYNYSYDNNKQTLLSNSYTYNKPKLTSSVTPTPTTNRISLAPAFRAVRASKILQSNRNELFPNK